MRRWTLCMVAAGILAGDHAVADEPLSRKTVSGPVTATVDVEPAAPTIGDTVSLTLTVVAEADVELLMPEFGEALERFTILDFAPRQSVDDSGRTVAQQTYRLQSPMSGPQAIPPILIEFVDRREGHRPAPEGLDAYELLTERIEFSVQSVLPGDVDAELRPPLGELEPLETEPPPRWPWMVAPLVILVLVSPLVVRAVLAWRRRALRRSAYEIASRRLERLLASLTPDAEHMDAFYVQLSSVVRRYLEDRFELRAPELTTEEFLDSVQRAPVLSHEHQHLLREFLREADLVKFAGLKPTDEDVNGSIAAARRFLEETRENAPLIDDIDQASTSAPLRDAAPERREAASG